MFKENILYFNVKGVIVRQCRTVLKKGEKNVALPTPRWFVDPAPDFHGILKPDDYRVIAKQQLDLQISAISREILIKKSELDDLNAEKKMLGEVQKMIG
jgi:hypothetical protein